MSYKKRKMNSFQPPNKVTNEEISSGCVVWAKWRANIWWPAITIQSTDCYQKDPKKYYRWVFWFGDHKVSEILDQNIVEFTASFRDFIGHVSKKSHISAVHEALKVLAIRSNFASQNLEDLNKWARNAFYGVNKKCSDLPDIVLKCLDEQKNRDISDEECHLPETELIRVHAPIIDKVKKGVLHIEDVCIACHKENVTAQHPLFKGGLCKPCKESLIETIYAIGEDGKNLYCIICGHLGNLILCDNDECPHSYCQACIAAFLDQEEQKEILESSPWFCFFCSKSKSHIFKKRDNWEENLSSFFQLNDISEVSYPMEGLRRPIRVLSLFDGISTGKVVLENLGIDIGVYYASEIDETALSVSKLRHRDSIAYVGDITLLTEEKLSAMCPIDLIIGGSPCNDLSLVNPLRKGLFDMNGTGCLFFDFFHVLRSVQRLNQGQHLFYLYENVAAMTQEERKIISKFLMHDPALIDAKYFSAQTRPRFFWGNIPGIYAHSRIYYKEENDLDNYLLKELGRKAKVRKINTVTTNRNSLKEIIMMNGSPDVLWITELEKIFGFPVHYTDSGNLSVNKRQELLGRSWSVPVIMKILCPLQNFFRKREGVANKE